MGAMVIGDEVQGHFLRAVGVASCLHGVDVAPELRTDLDAELWPTGPTRQCPLCLYFSTSLFYHEVRWFASSII